jgi:D-sedoheptulose 7-phosphate isomerase
MSFNNSFFLETIKTVNLIDKITLDKICDTILELKRINGRIFFLGIGGSAGNASHAVNDFRKLLNIECYCPTDNASEITARTNDEGFETIFVEYLKISKLSNKDIIFIFSVGGGSKEKNVSVNLIKAIDYAKKIGSKVLGVVAKHDGYLAQNGDLVIKLDIENKNYLTPISESLQVLIWHYIVSNPKLMPHSTKW